MEEKHKIYEGYMAEAIKTIGSLNVSYLELIKPVKKETRTAKQIINGIKEKLRQFSER